MEYGEAETVLQRLRGEYRSETVPDPNTFRPLRAVMDENSKGKGTPNKGSTKSQLYEICAVNHWKAPLFECCNEEGPDHHKLFTFKVIVEIKGPRKATIACMGNPHSKKKDAAENAAEGALWFLNQSGYRLIKSLN